MCLGNGAQEDRPWETSWSMTKRLLWSWTRGWLSHIPSVQFRFPWQGGVCSSFPPGPACRPLLAPQWASLRRSLITVFFLGLACFSCLRMRLDNAGTKCRACSRCSRICVLCLNIFLFYSSHESLGLRKPFLRESVWSLSPPLGTYTGKLESDYSPSFYYSQKKYKVACLVNTQYDIKSSGLKKHFLSEKLFGTQPFLPGIETVWILW